MTTSTIMLSLMMTTFPVASYDSEDLELPIAHNNVNNNVNNAANNRRGLRELINLGPVQNLPRLRSGRI